MNPNQVNKLKSLAKHDATVHAHFKSYEKGLVTFDNMVLNLAIQLQTEKKQWQKMAKQAVENKSQPTMFIMPEGNTH